MRGCEKRGSLLVWFFDICGLQFGIMREVCCRLVSVLWFEDLLFLGVLQLLDLICSSLFGLCTIGIWYLVFVFSICAFGSLVRIWFFDFVFVRGSYLGVFVRGFVRVPLHQFVLSQIWYSETCSSSPVDVGYCRTT